MTPLEIVAVLLAGCAAGTINTIVGSGTLITFPTLLAVGIPPVTANVSNTIGLVPGSLSGVWGYRAELSGQRARLVRLCSASLLGGALGSGAAAVAAQRGVRRDRAGAGRPGRAARRLGPRVSRAVAARAEARGGLPDHGAAWVWPAVAGAGVYGGYFGAAQGVLLMAILGIGVADSLQRHNATKNVLALLVNAVAAVVFLFVADVDWLVVLLVAVGSVVGGQIGATVGRRLPAGRAARRDRGGRRDRLGHPVVAPVTVAADRST